MELQAVVFDVGGVLCTSPVDEFGKVDAEHGLPDGTVQAFIRGGTTFAECETGRLPIQGFYDACIADIGSRHGVRIASARLDAMFTACMGDSARPEMLSMLHELKDAGHTLALLTNIYAERRGWLHETFPESLIDFYGDSSELGLRKPDPEIYRVLLDRLGLPAEAVAFVDDFPENLVPAQELGIRTVLFTSSEQARCDLVAAGARICVTPKELTP